MKLAVIGASGRTGRVFVDAALAAGHEVVAGIHRKNSIRERAGLTLRQCDATNSDDIKRLIADCDAVVSLIGHGRHSPADVQTRAMIHLIAAMQESGCKRLASLTGSGAYQPGDTPGLLERLLNLSIRVIDPKRVHDGIEHVKVLEASSVEWTVLRVLKLSNGESRPYSLTAHGPAKLFAPRTDVASALLCVLEQGLFVRQAPVLSRRISDD